MSSHANRLSSWLSVAVLLLSGAAVAVSPAFAGGELIGDHAEPQVLFAAKEIFIKGGCPYNLDKACIRDRRGKLVKCRCVS